MERPNLGGLLGPHFTPVAGGASTFLQMYQTVVDLATSNNVDLCFVLLTKVRLYKNLYNSCDKIQKENCINIH